MNVKDYIESGILEGYVLGGISAQEMAEVESMASMYPEIQEEIVAIRLTVEGMALQNPVSPSPDVKTKLFDNLDVETPVINIDSAKPGKRSAAYNYAVAASWALTVFSAGLAFYFFNKWKTAENQVVALQLNNKELANNFNLTRNSLDNYRNQLAALKDTTLQMIDLKAVPGKEGSFARVFWSAAAKKVYLNPAALPPAPDGRQYQLWAISDGKPVDAGVIDTTGTIQQLKNIDNAAAFAITLENAGGSPVPTLDQMYVMGAVELKN